MFYRWPVGAVVVVTLVIAVGCGGTTSRRAAPQAIAPAQSVARPAAVQPAQAQLLGDLDGDGKATVGDAIKVLRIVVGLDSDNPCADANQNQSTDVGDAIKVLRCVVGLEAWPIGVCGGTGKIAFLSTRDGNYEIYVMNADGSNQTRLTFNSAGDWWPAWSPFLGGP